jgi:cytochrome c-type biogenesis protein CcmH
MSRAPSGPARVAAVLTLAWTFALLAAPATAQTPDSATVPVVAETRLDSLTRSVAQQLRCPVCQGLSLQDSPSELAQEMRSVIREQLESGKSPEEVKRYFVGSYGEFILLEPEAKGFNLAVYILPVLVVLGGGLLVIVSARRWLTKPPGEPVESAAAPAEVDPDLASWEDISTR